MASLARRTLPRKIGSGAAVAASRNTKRALSHGLSMKFRTLSPARLALLGVLTCLALTIGTAQAQVQAGPLGQTQPAEAAPPEAGPPMFTCPTGRNKSAPVGERYIIEVTGKCGENGEEAVSEGRGRRRHVC